MAVLKCKMCGGDIDLSTDKRYGVCDACGSTVTLPKIEDEQRAWLFNRGNDLRMRGDFDKAAAVYEKIIEQDATDAEAHWCLALCKYGIEYVEDPQSGERIPTCHRMSYDSFLNDIDYGAAIENCDSYTAGLYMSEAKRITETQRGILAISKREEPYDVFICYKESTGGGNRTKDSLVAQEIYYELTEAGYKVFFSRITLEKALGTEYEPYIFAALNSAKVMLVVGTCAENFGAVWVKNEWSRFLSLMKKDRGRLLIPCYRDMDPYDLPDELAVFQSQDMAKIGFMQDLLHGIKKVLDYMVVKDPQWTSQETSLASQERLLQNGNTYLKLGNYEAAETTFKRVTEEYPEDYRGWWGLIVCETKDLQVVVKNLTRLITWLGYVKKLAPPEELNLLASQYAAYKERIAKEVRQNMMGLQGQMEELTQSKKQYGNKPRQHASDKAAALAGIQQKIAEAERRIAQCDTAVKERMRNPRKAMVAWVFIISALYFVMLANIKNNAQVVIPGTVVMFVVTIVIIVIFNRRHFQVQREVQSERVSTVKQLDKLRLERESLQNTHDSKLDELEKQEKDIDKSIAQLEKGIAECQSFLSTIEKMTEIFFT